MNFCSEEKEMSILRNIICKIFNWKMLILSLRYFWNLLFEQTSFCTDNGFRNSRSGVGEAAG